MKRKGPKRKIEAGNSMKIDGVQWIFPFETGRFELDRHELQWNSLPPGHLAGGRRGGEGCRASGRGRGAAWQAEMSLCHRHFLGKTSRTGEKSIENVISDSPFDHGSSGLKRFNREVKRRQHVVVIANYKDGMGSQSCYIRALCDSCWGCKQHVL